MDSLFCFLCHVSPEHFSFDQDEIRKTRFTLPKTIVARTKQQKNRGEKITVFFLNIGH